MGHKDIFINRGDFCYPYQCTYSGRYPVTIPVIPVHFSVAVDINLLEISFNADDSKLAYDAPYDRLKTWSEGGKSGRMFIYFVGPILASYVRSVWQKDDVFRKKFSSTEDVLQSTSPRVNQQPAKEDARLSRKLRSWSINCTK